MLSRHRRIFLTKRVLFQKNLIQNNQSLFHYRSHQFSIMVYKQNLNNFPKTYCSIIQSAKRIYSLIDDIISDLDNAPSFRSFSNAPKLVSEEKQSESNDSSQKSRKKKKKKIKQKKNKNNQDDKPTQQASKRATKLVKSELPPPTLINGIKSTLLKPMESTYDPFQVEALWDEWWEKRGYYAAKTTVEKKDKSQENFVMVIPPPNVTGSLHLGHALMATIEDTITRYWRMKGKNCLWLPGTDHAGIATQTVVERKLAREGKTRHDLGREEFLKQVWKWKEQKGGKICSQLRKMGCSVDWQREVFTMDDKLCKAVTEAFVRLYEKGLIYRDNRLCHWSCSLQSAISDVEIDKIEIAKKTKLSVPGYDKKIDFGIIHKFGYKVIDSDEIVTVATTRLETMLGDTAVAVHPDDKRYTHLHGKFVQHPFIQNRKIPIICDKILVDMTFGTGCVKITPAHDHNDFECGNRHNLEFINILNEDGTINANGGKFEGQKRYDVRYQLVKELDAMKLFFGEEENPMVLDQCSRSKDIIEPLIKPQWYMDCDDLAQQALDAVFKEKTLTILPQKEGEQQWQYFLGNIRKWCISRQLWWGHRIPAYKIKFNPTPKWWDINDKKLNWIVARSKVEAEQIALKRIGKASGKDPSSIKFELLQDEDVLDTWFSSGLFPFSTMGWPDKTADFESFFPGDLLETGGDIIFFWVARMVMMSLALFPKTLPFHTVYLHPMVRDERGAKMSKSSGNVIDPLHIIDGVELSTLLEELHSGNIRTDKIKKFEKMKKKQFPKGIVPCGADALRFGLSTLLVQRSINLNVNTVIGYRLFCNKIWNATKLALSYFDDTDKDKAKKKVDRIDYDYLCKYLDCNPEASISDKWILGRLNACIIECEKQNKKYEFGLSTQAIYQFFYHEFCPIYLECIKPTMWSEGNETKKQIVRDILYIALRESYKMMHPFMPFLTEELFQRIKKARFGKEYNFGDESIIVAEYPDKAIKAWTDDKIEEAMNMANDISSSIRSTKQSSLGLSTKTKYKCYIVSKKSNECLQQILDEINTMSMCESVRIFDESKQNANDYFMSTLDVYETVKKSVDDKKESDASYSVKKIADTITIYSEVKGLVKVEQRIKKFNKEIDKLNKLIAKAEKSLEKIDKESIRKKQEEKIKGYKENMAIYQDAIKQLEKMS